MMDNPMTKPDTAGTGRTGRWRIVDIVVASVLGVAFGVVFIGWNQLWAVTGGAFAAFPPAQGFMYGIWLLPAVLGPMIIRRAGSGLYVEVLATLVSLLGGAPWGGGLLLLYGIVEGLAGELAFALTRYRSYRLPVALLGGLFAGVAAVVLDWLYFYRDWAAGWVGTYALLVVVSSVVIAGLGAWVLTGALARTGALDALPSRRAAARI
jgi:energy-coupling factor transport system substrate-specific component